MKISQNRYFDRELSWLSFNHRVLQEAEDPRNPLLDRLKFLAIYSSNMEEFFRVRVASLRSLASLEDTTKQALLFNPKLILHKIHEEASKQQLLYNEIFRNDVVPGLRKMGIFLARSEELSDRQEAIVSEYYLKNIIEFAEPQFFHNGEIPALKDGRLYHAVRLNSTHVDASDTEVYSVISIPSHKVSRFFVMEDEGKFYVLFLGDVMRVGLKYLFPGYTIKGCFSIKISRDAEMHIEDEFHGNLVAKIKEGIEKRKSGVPMRFLYDVRMPEDMLQFFKKAYRLTQMDIIPGGRYHSLNDFMSFPNPNGMIPKYEPVPPLAHPDLEGKPIFSVIKKKDVMLHYPYHSFDYVVRWLEEAATDAMVTEIKVTLYRVAADSQVIKALILAAQQGKKVSAFVEVKARFNEADNMFWADKMQKAGIKVLYSIPAIKVHTKLCCVVRQEKGKTQRYVYLATGNMNEKTATLYTDSGLFTADPRLANEAYIVFLMLEQKLHVFENEAIIPKYEHLLVAPLDMRYAYEDLINYEIAQAQAGHKAHIIAKMNSLDDWLMIDKLYEASNAGVKIQLIIRGICCLMPGIKGQSENITAVSLVGRYLEHTRMFYFYHGGEEKTYLSSADWMRRNLDRRIEIAFPIYDKKIKAQIKTIFDMQLADNVNARYINRKQNNIFVRPTKSHLEVDTHVDMFTLLKKK